MLSGDEMTRRKNEYTQCEAAMTLALSAIYNLAWDSNLTDRERMSKAVSIAHSTLLNYVGGYNPSELRKIVG